MGFRVGAGYNDLEVTSAKLFQRRKVVAAANANIPTEMAMKLLEAWSARGYGLDVVLYRKYAGSPYVDPHEDDKVTFKDLPNRFPSVLSRDFRREQGEYRDYDNLFAMYVLYNLGKYGVRVNGESKLLEIDKTRSPMTYAEAGERAARSAEADSDRYRQGLPVEARGALIGESGSNSNAGSDKGAGATR